MATAEENLKNQFQLLQEQQQKKLLRRKQRKDEQQQQQRAQTASVISTNTTNGAFGVSDNLDLKVGVLTLSQTTNFRLFQTERICRRKF